ncbi:hypothetical protein PAAG_06041 [Paracoccidioides lutzii Pb01]|uniref:Uncharacterized protein n=1 Tax=Paracoccidioides lutzii (strain ATCC MYA-826 / Pb01) TaxID=502779 RepID=C1H5K0_PARBA|nr:hypothetical protein PAAG_06041 [Paracoccidioides lutzii Pb01]EEH34994.2 hypothetical protein PAAG_06041 [Paracoccidioides lutzii Pb01]
MSWRNIKDYATTPCRSDLGDLFRDCPEILVKADTAAERVLEVSFHICQSGESTDDLIVVDDSMVIGHDDEQRGESADMLTSPSMLSARETSMN